MNEENSHSARRWIFGVVVVIALGWVVVRSGGDRVEAGGELKDSVVEGDGYLQRDPEVKDLAKASRRGRGVLMPRASKGEVPAPNEYAPFGFLVVEHVIGSPQVGDLAYLARLGPQGGRMRVEAVEEGRVLLSPGNLDRAMLREGERIETMPPDVDE